MAGKDEAERFPMKYTAPIEIGGQVDASDVYLLLSDRKDITVFHPWMFRDFRPDELSERQPWISLCWLDYEELEGTQNVEPHTTQMLDVLKRIMGALTIETLPGLGPAHLKWTLESSWQMTELEFKVAHAFIWNMSNARGREMVSTILKCLFSKRNNTFVTNIGGGAINDSGVKTIHFDPTVVSTFSQSDSSPDNSPKGKDGSAKRNLMEEHQRVIKKPRPYLDEPTSLSSVTKNFVPNVLVEETDGQKTCREVLNVSVKSGHVLTERQGYHRN